MEQEYEERIIAFIDLLGFRSLIERLPKERRLFQKLKRALNQFSRENMFYKDKFSSKDELKAEDPGKEISNFSDTIVISYSLSISPEFVEHIQGKYDRRTEILISMLMDIMGLYAYLTPLGLAIRGSINIGKLYHTDDVIFGDALVSAYDSERKLAIYPRVIIAEKVISGTFFELIMDKRELEGKPFYIRRDVDGVLIFDHLIFGKEFGHGVPIYHLNRRNYKKLDYEKHIENVKKLVLEMVERAKKNPLIKPKAEWYMNYLLKHLEENNLTEEAAIKSEV